MIDRDATLPIDPNAKMPARVSEAAALAESYYKQAATHEAPTKEEAAAPLPVPGSEPVPSAGEAAVGTPAGEQPAPGVADYEHMYKSAQGRLTQAQQQAAELAKELQLQQQYSQQLQAQLNQPAKAAPPRLISDVERKEYGDEFFDVVTRAVAEAYGDRLNKVDELDQRNQYLEQQLVNTASQTLSQLVTTMVPNWQAIESDPGFLPWLSLRDVYTNRSRQELLQDAVRRSDAPAIAAFYRNYLAETGQSAVQQPQASPPSATPRQAAVSLESLVAPGRARPASVSPDAPVPKRTYTRQQIHDFYRQKTEGRWNSNPQGMAAMEADIFQAQHEGRVTG